MTMELKLAYVGNTIKCYCDTYIGKSAACRFFLKYRRRYAGMQEASLAFKFFSAEEDRQRYIDYY